MADNLSPLARQITPTTTDKIIRRKPWGFLIHTTGRGVPQSAERKKRWPIEEALEIYAKSQDGRLHKYKWGGPTYVMDYDGTLYQIAPDDIMTYHAGGPDEDRDNYLDGDWAKMVSPKALEHWRRQWPRHKSPQHLYPSKTANRDYVGVETIPCGSGFGVPMRPGLLFTEAQHLAAVELARDLAARHGWPTGWHRTSRLVGHEDVQLLQRHNAAGGWDPGWLRDKPYFDFEFVRSRI